MICWGDGGPGSVGEGVGSAGGGRVGVDVGAIVTVGVFVSIGSEVSVAVISIVGELSFCASAVEAQPLINSTTKINHTLRICLFANIA